MFTFYKKKYVYRITLLQQALNHMWILWKVHATVKFNQNRWLEPYISSNTYCRSVAENEFEKYINNFLSNSVFSKSIQSDINEKDICVFTNKNMRNKHAASMDFKVINFISELI